MLQSSWKISFVRVFEWPVGEGLEPKTGSIVEGWKVLISKKTFSSIATKFQADVILIWLVFCITSLHWRHAYLLACGFCEIYSTLAVSTQVLNIQADEDENTILPYFHEIKGNELQKHAFILNLSLWGIKNIKKKQPH